MVAQETLLHLLQQSYKGGITTYVLKCNNLSRKKTVKYSSHHNYYLTEIWASQGSETNVNIDYNTPKIY